MVRTTVVFQPKKEWALISQGAEARIYKIPNYLPPNRAAIAKERFAKTYRHPALDERLTKARTRAECRALLRARRGGVPCPAVWGVVNGIIYLEYLDGATVRHYLNEQNSTNKNNINNYEGETQGNSNGNDDDAKNSQKSQASTILSSLATEIGTLIAKLHNTGTIHGDLTTSNMIYSFDKIHLIDFGLAKVTQNPEELAVDLYVLERALVSTHPELEDANFLEAVLTAYKAVAKKSDAVLQRLSAVRLRGRKRECFG